MRHFTLAMLIGSIWAGQIFAADKVLTVYSERKEQLIKPVFDLYTKETGVKIEVLTDSAATLVQRLKGEGKKSPADILLTVDAGNLWNADKEGLFQPIDSKILAANVPAHLRDPKNDWFGLSVRARTIVYNPNKIKADELKTYASLADPKFKKRLCLRSSKKVYNQSLVGVMIAEKGEKETEKVVRGWVDNLAAPVFSDDVNVIEAIDAGQCDAGIVNSYYYGRVLNKNPKAKVKLFFPAKADGGTHVNISGAGVLKNAPHKDEAVKLLEWLSSKEAQGLFAEANFEYPVNPEVKPSTFVQSWGPIDSSEVNVAKAGELQAQATKLMDRAGYR